MEENIELTVRVQPSGDEVTIELEIYTSGKEIKKALIDQNIAPSSRPDGTPIIYELISKSANQTMDDHNCLCNKQTIGLLFCDILKRNHP